MEIEKANQPKIYEKMDFESGGIIKNASEQALKGKAVIDSNIEIYNKWQQVFKIGPGFANLGNTCFFNSVLQCLTYSPPLANYLLSGEHKKNCPRKESFCAICLLEQHVEQCFSQNRPAVIQPRKIIQNMRFINKKFKLGRQDDSHELLRLLVESMQKSALDFKTKVDQKLEEATPIYKMFGGKLKSQVECQVCKYRSENFETFYDLSLECKESIQKSFDIFFKKEKLEGNNKYRCSKCKKLVEAQKGYVIHQLPNIFTIQIKRFNNFMMKINTHTQFPAEIDLSKYVQQTVKKPEIYDLYGVLIHVGGGLHFGHYYCYVKNSNNMWYCMNDSSVSQRSFQEVSKERPYLLFYIKRETITKPKRKSSADLSSIQKEVIPQTNGATVVPEKQQDIVEEKDTQKSKTLCEEYKEINNSEKSKEYMKQLDDIFAIKTKKDNVQKAEKIVEESKEPQLNGHQLPKENGQQKSNMNGYQQEEQKIEEEKVENSTEEDTNKEIDEKFYQMQKDRLNNKYARCLFQVVRFKKIKKLRYIADNYMRQRLRAHMMHEMQSLGSSSASLLSQSNSYEESKEKVKQSSNGLIHTEALAQELLAKGDQKSQKIVSNGSTAQSTPETKQQKKPNEQIKKTEQNVASLPQTAKVQPQGGLLQALHSKTNGNGLQVEEQNEPQKKTTSSPLNLSSLDQLSKSDSMQSWNIKEVQKLVTMNKSVVQNNKHVFEYAKKEKDEYDIEYDQGKLKKIKKKKEKQRINFDKLAQQNKRQKTKNGYQSYLKKKKYNGKQ